MRNGSKALAVSLCAALLLLAAGSGSAEAAAPEFHSESAPVIFEGSQVVKHVFTDAGGTVSCKKVEFKGTEVATKSTTVSLSPVYLECTAFGRASTVDTNGCKEVFHLVAGSSPPTATADLTGCNAGSGGIVSTTPSLPCNVIFPEQVGVKHVTFENQGTTTNRDVLATINATGIRYIESGAGCLGEGAGEERADGSYKGTTTVKGFLDTGGTKGAQEGIWIE